MPKISDLKPGTKFRYPGLDKRARLVALGPSGAVIRWIGQPRQVAFDVTRGGELEKHVAFTAKGKTTVVSDASEVEVVK